MGGEVADSLIKHSGQVDRSVGVKQDGGGESMKQDGRGEGVKQDGGGEGGKRVG